MGSSPVLTDLQKSDKYQKAVSLNLDCGSDTLRKMIETELGCKGKTFKKYIKDPGVQNKISNLKSKKVLFKEQITLLNTKDTEYMDISLLTLILLELFPTTSSQKTNLKMMRKKRNELAHRPKAMLEDDVPFIEASQIIVNLAKDISSDFENEIRKRIEDLKNRELVRTRCSMDIILLNNEALMMKLVETGKNEKADCNDEIWIKFGLTRYVRQLSKFVDVDVLLQELKNEGMIIDKIKNRVDQTYNNEEQMHQFVLHMMTEKKETILKLCLCLRKTNCLLADLVQNKTSFEKDIGQKLQETEMARLCDILKESVVLDKTSSLACEDVHILCEEKCKYNIKFAVVQASIKECFPGVNFDEKDSRFHGIKWKDSENLLSNNEVTEDTEETLSDMSCDKFGEYLARKLEKVKEGIGIYFEETASEECISAEIFASLTDDQVSQLFSTKLKDAGFTFAFGIKRTLSNIQKAIKFQLRRSMAEKKCIMLRKFDSAADDILYTKSTVESSAGNLLTPAHLFVCPLLQKQNHPVYIVKEVIKFATACINGKKNGTIHFGIKEVGNRIGEIIGLPKDYCKNVKSLDDAIMSGIKVSFDQKHQSVAQRCIRPVQKIPVEEEQFVFEIDIVPFSGYIEDNCIQINYPPKGVQRRKCFVIEDNTINTIEESKIDGMKQDLENLYKERLYLEMKNIKANRCDITRTMEEKNRLMKLLTGGNKYVTDAFIPIICSGDISGCQNERFIREHISCMAVAFISSLAVFDFDSSVELRNVVEKGNTFFQVKMAEDFSTKRSRRESDISGENNIWLYSNGNEELGKGSMASESWYGKRLPGVKNALQQIRQQIPLGRGLLIYLIFQKPIDCDPLLELARETFLTSFKGECIVITDDDTLLQEWRKEMKGKISKQEFDSKVVTGLSWEEVAATVKDVFKPNKDVLFKFPHSAGTAVEMTSREMEELQLKDIELVDGFAEEHCSLMEESESDENCQRKRTEEQENFYKGNAVTVWNFYYATQVATRSVFEEHKKEISYKILSNGSKDRFDIHNIDHHPGAGGSTLGHHLLWHFSQIGRNPESAFRCCIVHKITEDTAEEIHRFREFKEKRYSPDVKPVIVLVDNKSEEHISVLKTRLDEIAYKEGSPGKLFCLLLLVTRVPVSYASRGIVLRHNLTKREQMWFDKKSKELETNANLKIKTLIAFNVMRHSFEHRYIKDTTQRLFEDMNDKEKQILGYLSVICCFDSDNPVPEHIFDSIMNDTVYDPDTLTLDQCLNRPFGTVYTQRQRQKLQPVERETWNIRISDAMQLVITHREIKSDTRPFMGVCILSQPLSKVIMEHIMQVEKKSFRDMVVDLLNIVENHASETNPMSKHFVKIICSLFTSRESFTDEKGEKKVQKFSPLILRLEMKEENDIDETVHRRVIEVIGKCFSVCRNAMVGQQLARYFYINLKDYASAEDTIKQCLSQLPHNSYLLDTYGQIFKTKMEQLFSNLNGKKMANYEAAECIKLASMAVEKFKLAQEASTQYEDNTAFNSNSFYMEVMTALSLLEHFHKFDCYISKESFWKFLNEEIPCSETSPYAEIISSAPSLDAFRKGQEIQHHLEMSLRTLEERAYMARHLTTVFTPSGDTLLLKPREKFEMFYGSKEHTSQFEFLFGVGLKLLMKADTDEESRRTFEKRVFEAERRLENKIHTEQERDLLVYLGYNIIRLSSQKKHGSSNLYRNLLNYSTNLWKIQQAKNAKDRKYIEAYLYYALLHWILPARTELGIEGLSHPETYSVLLKDWEGTYMSNSHIKTKEQLFREKPKIYFAIGNGRVGNDIVDLEWLRHLWREAMLMQGRKRKEVKADNHWQHPIFEERLARMHGTVDSSGRRISTEVCYNKRNYEFKIRTNESHEPLRNRAVTFVLAFSWMDLVALDVRKHDKYFRRQNSQISPENTEENLFKNDKGYSKKAAYTKREVQETQVTFSNDGDERHGLNANSSIKTNTSSVGRGRGRGNGNQGVSQTGTRPKLKEAPNVGHESVKGSSSRKDMKSAAYVEKAHGVSISKPPVTQDTSAKPKHKSGSVNNFKQKKSEEALGKKSQDVAWSTVAKGTASHSGQNSPKNSSANVNVKEDMLNPEDQDLNGGEEEWVTVKKKSSGVKKEKQFNFTQLAATGSSSATFSKQEKFEELIKKCQEKYPDVSRDKLINAYNDVKRKHGGKMTGLRMENILEEIGKHLK